MSFRYLAAAALFTLPLLGKAGEFWDDGVPGDVRLRAALTELIGQHGAREIHAVPLSLDAAYILVTASYDRCAGGMRAMAMNLGGDAVGLFAEAMRPEDEIVFVYRGGVHRDVPRWRVFIGDGTDLVLSRLGLRARSYNFSLLAIAAAPDCRFIGDIPWAHLWRT